MQTIKFTDNMPKLQGQTTATLVNWGAMSGYQLQKHPDFWNYDTLKSDGTNYKLNNDGNYLILYFVGDKGILFSTIRKLNEVNKHYITEIGKQFKIEIINPLECNTAEN